MSLPGTELRSLPGSVSLVGELRLPASLGCVPGPGQCMGPGRDPCVGAATESACRALGSMPPFLAMLRSGQVLGKAHLNKERCLTELSQTMLHLTTRESRVAGPVQAPHPWPVSFGLLAPVAMGSQCPSSKQSRAGHGVLPVLVVHLRPCPSHAPRSAGLSGDVVAAPCSPASTAQAALGREASVKLLVGKGVPGSSGAGEEASGRKSWVGWG